MVFKTQNPDEIKALQRAYWHSKTPQERLDAALQLILQAKALYNTNSQNAPLDNGTRILKSRSPIERRER